MPSVFPPAANFVAKLVLLGMAGVILGGIGWWWAWARTDYVRHRDWVVDQPVPFSHRHHAGELHIDCRFCHATVETSGDAGMPPTYTCMTCHSQIWTNAAMLAPVRQSLAQNQPIAWHRVTDLPDYVYFNHAIHIAKGVGCAECHGDVAAMPMLRKPMSMTMQFCLDCHRNPGPHLRPPEALFDTKWQRDATAPTPASLLQQYGVPDRSLTDCSICHR